MAREIKSGFGRFMPLLVGMLVLVFVGLVVFSVLSGDGASASSSVDSQSTTSSVAQTEPKKDVKNEAKKDDDKEVKLEDEAIEALAREQTGAGYASLNEAQQRLYLRFLIGINGLKEQFKVSETNLENLKPCFNAVMMDHPELFWINGSNKYEYDSEKGIVTVTPGLAVPLDQVPNVRARIESVVGEFLATVPADASEYTKARMAYEYIANTTENSEDIDAGQSIQSVFLNHRSVCGGYAKAYQYLLQRMGMYCAFVEGTIPSRGEEHTWNLARIDGVYTYVDVTWGDPTYVGDPDEHVELSYDYFCLTTEEILRDGHVFDNESMWPLCTSRVYDNYGLTGRLFDVYDENALYYSLREQVGSGVWPVAFKFTNEGAYVAAVDSLTSGGSLNAFVTSTLAEQGRSGAAYWYRDNDGLYILKVYV